MFVVERMATVSHLDGLDLIGRSSNRPLHSSASFGFSRALSRSRRVYCVSHPVRVRCSTIRRGWYRYLSLRLIRGEIADRLFAPPSRHRPQIRLEDRQPSSGRRTHRQIRQWPCESASQRIRRTHCSPIKRKAIARLPRGKGRFRRSLFPASNTLDPSSHQRVLALGHAPPPETYMGYNGLRGLGMLRVEGE